MTIDIALDRSIERTLGWSTGTSPAWGTVHRRTAALREVVASLDKGGHLPADPATHPATAGAFSDLDDLLLALHEVWSRRLTGRIDLALETDDHGLEESVARAWTDTEADLPGVRRVLDAHADSPSLQHLERSELRTVAVAAGLATLSDPVSYSSAVGARFVTALRARAVGRGQRSWRRRLRLAFTP